MKRLIFLLTVLPLLTAGCITVQPVTNMPQSGTPTAAATLPSIQHSNGTSAATDTPQPPAATATPAPIDGTLTIKVNVRSGPATSYTALGQLDAGGKIQVMLKDATGNWYQILYPAAPGGIGWVSAQYVTLAAGVQVPLAATPTPSGPQGRVSQILNVRSGPGTTYDSLGTLQPNTTVALTGKDATASWFQISYPKGPGGRAWVTSQYVQTDASGSLPVLDAYGTPVPGSTAGPVASLPAATATVGPAFDNGDSAANPAVQVTFSTSGTRQITYSGQVSAPAGNPEDWVEFTPFAVNASNAMLVFSLTCTGNGTLTVTLEKAGSPITSWGTLACGDHSKLITLPAGHALEMELAPAPGQGLQLVNYDLTIENMP
jgi:uncharacterized protein YgiM (DUF1202 family)